MQILWKVVRFTNTLRLGGIKMLILTSINPATGAIKVFDTDDGTNELSHISLVYNALCNGNITIKGLRVFQQGVTYPLDARCLMPFNVVVLPSEAESALRNH